MRRTGRRDFLRRTSLAGAGFWVGARAATVHAKSPNEKLNIGMIGCGGKGWTNLLLLTGQGHNIVALCDVDEKRAARAFRMKPKAKRYHDFRKMLEARKDLDAVVVSTPDHTHAAASVMAMRLGKHVYCEKPMAHSIHESRLMTQVAAETKVATQMGNQGHAGANLRRAVKLVQAGTIGKVREFHAWTNRPTWPQGIDRPAEVMPVPEHIEWDLWLGPAPKRGYHEAYAPHKWRGWWDFGTGALGDMACHVADLGFWALKLGYPTHVEAEVSAIHPETAPKWSIVRYAFPARGDLPPVNLTWYDGGKKPDPSLADGEPIPSNGSLLIGDEGKLFVPETYGAKHVLLPREKFADPATSENNKPNWMERLGEASAAMRQFAEWVMACKGGRAAKSNFVDYAGLLTEVVLLGNVAIRTGTKLEWDAAAMKAGNCPEANQYIHPAFRDGWNL